MAVYYYLNDNLLEIDELSRADDNSYVNTATITVTVVDSDGINVAGQSWPLTVSYVAGSNGKYQATLQDAMTVSPGDNLTAQITADAGANLRGRWDLPLEVRIRTS